MFTRRKTADVSALSSYGSCETKNKRCASCILTINLVTRTNYYDNYKGSMERSGRLQKPSKAQVQGHYVVDLVISYCFHGTWVFFTVIPS